MIPTGQQHVEIQSMGNYIKLKNNNVIKKMLLLPFDQPYCIALNNVAILFVLTIIFICKNTIETLTFSVFKLASVFLIPKQKYKCNVCIHCIHVLICFILYTRTQIILRSFNALNKTYKTYHVAKELKLQFETPSFSLRLNSQTTNCILLDYMFKLKTLKLKQGS